MAYGTKKSSLETVEEYLVKKNVLSISDQERIIEKYNSENIPEISGNTVIKSGMKVILVAYISEGMLDEEFSVFDYCNEDEY